MNPPSSPLDYAAFFQAPRTTVSQRIRIKICGITRPEDARAVADSGADALGLNFSDQSPRRIDVAAAQEIAKLVEGQLTRVGLFVDPDHDAVARVLDGVALDLLQFHGNETAEFCEAFGRPYMKVHRVADRLDVAALAASHPKARYFMLDTFVQGQPGGTGKSFDWSVWPKTTNLKLVLAGGLTPENVGAAIQATRPFAVDVSGGVEGPSKGIKDAERIRRFVTAVRQVDS